jgi:integrase
MAMTPVAAKKELARDSKGECYRRIGKKPNGVPGRFMLGFDEREAMARNLRIEKICAAVGGRWDDFSYQVAQAVAEGQNTVALDPTEYLDGLPDVEAARLAEDARLAGMPAPLLWAKRLTEKFGVTVNLGGETAKMNGYTERVLEGAANRHLAALEVVERKLAQTITSNATLHAALDAFADAEKTRLVEVDGTPKAARNRNLTYIGLLKEHQTDMLLSRFGEKEMLAIFEYWRKRPLRKNGDRMAEDTVKDVIKLFRGPKVGFLAWLHREKRFGWRKPDDLVWPNLKIELTPLELDAKHNPNQVETYNPEELAVLWSYATPLERCYIALALNFGFGQMELRTLLAKDVDIATSWVGRVRQKTTIYAEWKAWPATVEAVKWLLARRPASAGDCPYLFVTDTGKPLAGVTKGGNPKGNIANAWRKLLDRVKKDHEGFRELSFNKLRKTAGNLVKKASDGEVVRVFHSRGETNSDAFADDYTDRDFDKVFEALEKVWAKLKPIVFDPVTAPFPANYTKSHPSISLGTIRKIKRLRQEGHKIAWIATEVQLPVKTVGYWLHKK